MRRKGWVLLLTISLLGCLTQLAHAWGKAGHMVVAGIAYRDLKRSDPDKVDRVVALLKRHPQFNSLWKSQLEAVAQEDRDQLLFMLAARWPDDIRGRNSPFDHPKHH